MTEGFPDIGITNSETTDSEVKRATFINPNFAGEKTSESRTDVLLSHKRLINESLTESSGAFGTVYAVDVQVVGDDTAHSFVLKEFHGAGTEASREATHASLMNHRHAKQAGLKVWKTYRISEDKESILMSTGNADGWEIVGASNKLDAEQKAELLHINDFKSFLTGYYQEAQKAAEEHILIDGDVPFFRVRGGEIDFVLGDTDQLRPSDEEKEAVLQKNLQNMHSRLVVFFEDNFGDIDDDADEGFAGEAEKYIQQSANYIAEHFGQSVERYVTAQTG